MGIGKGSNCYQVTQCDVGVSRHPKTHLPFMGRIQTLIYTVYLHINPYNIIHSILPHCVIVLYTNTDTVMGYKDINQCVCNSS